MNSAEPPPTRRRSTSLTREFRRSSKPFVALVAAQRRHEPTLSFEVCLAKVRANGGRSEVLDVGVDAHVGLDFDEGDDGREVAYPGRGFR